MTRFPTGFTCLAVDKSCPWFTVGKIYNAIYKDDGVFIQDDEKDGQEWKLKRTDNIWMIGFEYHTPRIIATFNEQE